MRLIDADALLEAHCAPCKPDIREMCKIDPVCGSAMWIAEAPQVDAVPVVRCKDCEYSRELTSSGKRIYGDECVFCMNAEASSIGYNVVWADHFCSCGERKADE